MENKTDLTKSLAEEIYKQNLELLEQRRRVEQLLYSVSESVFAINDKYNFTLFNHISEQMLSKKRDEVIGTNAKQLIILETDKGEPIQLEQFCFQTDLSKAEMEAVVLHSTDRSYYINVKSAIIEIADGTKECLVTMTDITHEKELEKTKNDFVSVTSHELRTPMTIIKSYLWMLQNEKGGPLSDKQKEYVEKAVRGTERMLNLINDTLNISRIEQGRIEFHIEKVNYPELLGELEAEFKVKTDERNLYLKMEIDPKVSDVWVDRNKLREILTNFVGNSVKFTKMGGITVKVEMQDDGMVKSSVIDTGKGIAKEDMAKLFHKFSRLDNSYQTVAESGGTGLGLFIVKSLVEAMGGAAGAFSDGVDRGSTFWFTLRSQPPETKAVSSIA
ncbi:MAG TPA: ATP-binding protein [Candidatus Saccharimonadales bacterium]|nr:ATP-binding protein [Candidatus Saccharimonadales bacterium]